MLSDDLKCFSFFFAKVPEILHVVFNGLETHHPVFFLAVLPFVFEILRIWHLNFKENVEKMMW